MTDIDIALREWRDKTEWVQKTSQPDELGMHRADVLRKRIESRDAEIERLRTEITSLQGSDVLYYEMPGGVRFPVGKAVREKASAERDRIMAIVDERIRIAEGFIHGAADAGVEPSISVLSGLMELRSLRRKLGEAA